MFQMCCGQWLGKDEVDVADTRPGVVSQVALGGQDGSVYIMSNFQVNTLAFDSSLSKAVFPNVLICCIIFSNFKFTILKS